MDDLFQGLLTMGRGQPHSVRHIAGDGAEAAPAFMTAFEEALAEDVDIGPGVAVGTSDEGKGHDLQIELPSSAPIVGSEPATVTPEAEIDFEHEDARGAVRELPVQRSADVGLPNGAAPAPGVPSVVFGTPDNGSGLGMEPSSIVSPRPTGAATLNPVIVLPIADVSDLGQLQAPALAADLSRQNRKSRGTQDSLIARPDPRPIAFQRSQSQLSPTQPTLPNAAATTPGMGSDVATNQSNAQATPTTNATAAPGFAQASPPPLPAAASDVARLARAPEAQATVPLPFPADVAPGSTKSVDRNPWPGTPMAEVPVQMPWAGGDAASPGGNLERASAKPRDPSPSPRGITPAAPQLLEEAGRTAPAPERAFSANSAKDANAEAPTVQIAPTARGPNSVSHGLNLQISLPGQARFAASNPNAVFSPAGPMSIQAVDVAFAADLQLSLQGSATSQLPQTVPPSASPAHSPAHRASHVAHQIASILQDRSTEAGQPIELALDPPELGRVRMQMAEIAGLLTLTIHADRPETAELMRRHMDLLSQEFAEAGVDAPSVRISQDGSHAQSGEDGHKAENDAGPASNEPPTENAQRPQGPNQSGALDLRL